MGARQKLNVAHINGGLLIAAAAGILLESWTAFVITLAIILALAAYAGEIRPSCRSGGTRRE
jgi:hypothetical protein